jgi:hypothetical protein
LKVNRGAVQVSADGSLAARASRRGLDANPIGLPRLDFTAFAVACCGALSQISVKIIGELPIGEPLFLIVALVLFLFRGTGPNFSPSLYWALFVTGMAMVIGYVVSDLIAVTGPAQYLRGWARVFMLLADCIAIQVVLSHGYRYLWWFVAGLAVEILAANLIDLKPLTSATWKSDGYGVAIGLLVTLACGYLPGMLASAILSGFGLVSLALDFRSLGAMFVIVGLVLMARTLVRRGAQFPVLRTTALLIALPGMAVALQLTLTGTESEYLERRLESNLGRYVGLVVATQAIADSPLIGYGSWAADKRYTQMLKQEAVRASARTKRPIDAGDSMLPHSQVLQAWVEGGLLAAIFFFAYAVAMVRAFLWLAHRHAPGRMTPLLLIVLAMGAWNLLASPLGGTHRIFIMLVVGATALLMAERRFAPAATRPAGAGPTPAGSARQRRWWQ